VSPSWYFVRQRLIWQWEPTVLLGSLVDKLWGSSRNTAIKTALLWSAWRSRWLFCCWGHPSSSSQPASFAGSLLTTQRRLALRNVNYLLWLEDRWRGHEAVRDGVGLRLGLSLCVPQCGSLVKADGVHSFVCRRSPGRTSRHHALNDLVARAVAFAGLFVNKEPMDWLAQTANDRMVSRWCLGKKASHSLGIWPLSVA